MNVDGTKFLSWFNAQGIQESLGLSESFSQNDESFNELDITKVYRESSDEEKNYF